MQQPVFVNKSAKSFSPKAYPMHFGQSNTRQQSFYTVKPMSPIQNPPKIQYMDPRQNRAPSVVSEAKPLTNSNFVNVAPPKQYQVNQISMVSCPAKNQAAEKENNVNSLCKQFEPIAVKYNQLIRNLSILNPQLTQNQEIAQTENANFHSFVTITPQKDDTPNIQENVQVQERPPVDVYKIVNENKEWQQLRVELSLKEGEVISLKEQLQAKDLEIQQLRSQPQRNNLEEYILRFRAELEEKENIINGLSGSLCQANTKIAQLQAEPKKIDNFYQREQELLKEIEKLNKIVEYQDYEYPNQLQKQKYESDAVIDDLMNQVNQLQQELYQRRGQNMYYQDFQEQIFYLKEENRKLNGIIRNRCQY